MFASFYLFNFLLWNGQLQDAVFKFRLNVLLGQLIADKVEQFHQRGHEEVVVMLDLFGGTPCNQTIRLLRAYSLQVVVGVNLPMILQAVLANREGVTASQLIAMAVDNGRGGIFDAGARIQSLTEEE